MTSCILSLIKDEHEYLEDFITHHISIGIDKIFLYEDITSSSHKDICAKYPQVILASARDLLGNETDLLKKSRIFHMECIIRGLLYIQQNYNFDWCFSIDADEFIQLNGSLEQYKDYEALIIPWVNYGYSGHILKPEHNRPIWEIFTQQCGFTKYDEQHGFITKVCYNMHKLKLHFIHGNHNALCNKVYPKDIHINHYITKSFEEWLWKINVRGITAKDHRGIQDFFEMHQNLKYEDIIQQYNYMRYSSKQSLRGYDKAALGSITPTIAGYVVVSDPRLPHEMKEEVLRDYVEIGGIKWATMNIGAQSETDPGLYFAWGETQGYTLDQIGTDRQFSLSEYNLKYSTNDNKTILDPGDDAATVNWGNNWRMPTIEEINTLSSSTNYTWVDNYKGSGINGVECVDKIDNTKTLFFPACGHYINGVNDSFNEGVLYPSREITDGYNSDLVRGINVQKDVAVNYNIFLFDYLIGSQYMGVPIRPVLEK